MSPRTKLLAFENAGKQLLKTSIAVIKKLEDEKADNYNMTMQPSSFSYDDTENVIKMSRAATRIKSFWKGYKVRKLAQSMVSNSQNSIMKKTDYNLFMQLNDLLKPKGLDLETLYKISTTDNADIPCIEFIEAVEKLNVPMNRRQLRRICGEIDEDRTETIKYTDYMQCLESFGIPTKLYANKHIGYGEECMQSLVGVLKRKSINPTELFKHTPESTTHKDITLSELPKALEKLSAGFYKREIRAIMLYLDPNKTGNVTKEEFLLLCKSAEAQRRNKRNPKRSKPVRGSEKSIESVIRKMRVGNISISDFIEVTEKQKTLSSRMMTERLELYYPMLNSYDIKVIMKHLQFNNDLIEGKEVAKYFRNFESKRNETVPLNVYFKLMANYVMCLLEITPKEYLRKHKVKDKLSIEELKVMVREMPESVEDKVIESMWKSIEKGNASSFIDILENHKFKLNKTIDKKDIFKKLDERLLEKGSSVQEVFESAPSLTFGDFNDKLSKTMNKRDLAKLTETLKERNKTHVFKEQLISFIQKSRVTDKKTPLFGNVVHNEAERSIPVQKNQATDKITPESFIEIMLALNWTTDGRVLSSELCDAINSKYKGILTEPEVESLLNIISEPNNLFTPLARLLRFYDRRIYTPKWDSKVVLLDLLAMKAGYVKSQKVSVADYFRDLGIAAAQVISQRVFGRFLRHHYRISDQGVKRLCDYFVEGLLIPMQKVIDEITGYEFVKSNAELDCDGEAIKALKMIEEATNKLIQETFGNIDFTKDGLIDIQSIVMMLKNENKVQDKNLIESAIRPLMNNTGSVSINKVQSYLIRCSPSKEPSVNLELAHIHHSAQIRVLDVKTYLKSLEIPLSGSMLRTEFTELMVKNLKMNALVAEIISDRIRKSGTVNMQEFLKLLSDYKYKPYGYVGKLTISKIINELETHKNPLFDLLNHLRFDETLSTTLSFVNLAISEVYPTITYQYQSFITAYLDPEKKESIKLRELIAFIERNSKHFNYPNLKELCKKLIKNSSIINADEKISLNVFVNKFTDILKIKKKELYYLYDKFTIKINEMKTFKELFTELEKYTDESESRVSPKGKQRRFVTSTETGGLHSMAKSKNKLLNCICDYLYSRNMIMSEEILFRQMDTNRDGFIKRIEIKRWLERVKIHNITDKDINDFFYIVDKNNDGVLDFNEFLNAIKSVRGSAIISSVKVPITELIKQDTETILKQAIKKLTEYIAKKNIKTIEAKFMIHDKFKNGVLSVKKFKEALSDLGLLLRPEEIE